MLPNILKFNRKSTNKRTADQLDPNHVLQQALLKISDQQHFDRSTSLQGFASASYRSFIARFYDLAHHKNLSLLSMQGYQQTEEYTCGAASIMSLLHFYGRLSNAEMTRETELRISAEMGSCSKVGTSVEGIANWLKSNGFNVMTGENGSLEMLHDNLKKGVPTLVEWMDWGGHWSIVSGYDAASTEANPSADVLLLADSSAKCNSERSINGLVKVNANRFKSMWFDAQYFRPGEIVKGIYIIAVPKK
jgi:predicted double-glycine peptidase